MQKILDRVRGLVSNPVAARAAVAAVLNALVHLGVLDSGASEQVEVSITEVLSLLLLVSGVRARKVQKGE